jgi:hypothetical protein
MSVKFNLVMSAAVRGMLGRFSIKGASCPLTYVTRVLCQHNLGSCVLKLTGSEGFFFSGSTTSAASHSPQILNYALHKLGVSSVSVIHTESGPVLVFLTRTSPARLESFIVFVFLTRSGCVCVII